MIYPRSHPAPLETCGIVADLNAVTGQPDRLVHDAGAACPPDPVRDGDRPARAQDPDRVARPRRRIRQQGAGLPGLPVRDRGVDGDGAAGEVDGGQVGEPDVDHVRPRLPHARRDRGDRGRHDPRPAGAGPGRSRRLQRDRAADEVPGRVLPHLHRVLRPAGGVLRGDRRLHEQGAGRRRATRARSASPRPCTWSSGWSTCWPASSAWIRPSCGCATCCGPSSSRTPARPAGSTTPATTRGRCRWRLDIAGYDELRREQAERRVARRVHGHRAISFFTEGVGAGPREHMDILGPGHGRRR